MKKQRINTSPTVPMADGNGDGAGKIPILTHTPALGPRIRNEDLTGTVTRYHRAKASGLAPKMPAATALGGVHRTPRGAAGATAPQRPLRRTTVDG